MFVNTQYFREPAIYFEKHGRYEDGDFDSYECVEYWQREHERIRNGYEVSGTKITGMHYLYLNYLPIVRNSVKDEDQYADFSQELFKIKRKARRGEGFVDFWDSDYMLFWTWEIAKEGVPGRTYEEKLENLKIIDKHLNIPLKRSHENLMGGKNHLWLKPRGVGASWKGAVIPTYNQFFRKSSNTFLIADEKKFLEDDGLFTKYLTHRNTLMSINDDGMLRCAGFNRVFSKQDKNDMHYRASKTRRVELEGQTQIVEVGGMRSTVKGLSINGDPNNARGKRGDFVYEEFGSFPKVAQTWNINQSAAEQEGMVFGTQYGFGTGGDEESTNIHDLATMFNDPTTYNILEFNNIYDQELKGMLSAYFTPAYISLSYKDKDGNSDIKAGIAYLDHEEEIKKEASDPRALTQFKAEKPRKPSDALTQAKGNRFPVRELKAHKTYLIASKIHRDKIITGRFSSDITNAQFRITNEAPYEDYPIKANTTHDHPVCIVHKPKLINGRVPRNMYRISLDPYRQESSTGDSIGSCYVLENPNRLTPYKGDRIVAWYNARPESQDYFNKTVFDLCEYYNCKVAPENDEPGGLIDFAKRFKKVHLLEEQFDLAYDVKIATKSSSKRSFGMHIASGKDDLRKLQGDTYIKEWLLRKRGERPDGTPLYNLHYIYDVGLIEELIKYPVGNFDRLSSFRINMYYERELEYKQITAETDKLNEVIDEFFEMELFAA